MQKALNSVKRDIVYSLCQYGMGDVWKWGAEVDGNLWNPEKRQLAFSIWAMSLRMHRLIYQNLA